MSDTHDGYVPIVEDKLGPDEGWEDERGIYANIDEIEIENLPDPIEKYLQDHVKNRYSKRTWYNRVSTAKHWLVYCYKTHNEEDEETVDHLNPEAYQITDFVNNQLGAGYAQSTMENRIYDLSAMFKYLSLRGYTDENFLNNDDFEIGLESGDKFEDIRYIEQGAFDKILNAAEKVRDKLLLSMLWDTGVRSEEIVSIYVEDLRRDRQKIKLKEAKQRGERNEDRTVFYTRRTESFLKEYLDRGTRQQNLGSEESPYLFIGQGTLQLNERRPTELVREFAEVAGIQSQVPVANAAGHKRRKVTAHCFRHSFAVLRVKKGMPIVYLSDLLGHDDVEQTRVYLKFRTDDLEEAYKKYRPCTDPS